MSEPSHHHHPDRLPGGSRGRGASRGRGRGGARTGGPSATAHPSQQLPGSIPSGSISKLKAQIRQTKRLLTKEDLNPDVRTTSERRLKTLEVELEKATTSDLEKKMVSRYRGIRFFERQKLLRKIKQAKKALLATPDDTPLAETLRNARIDLHYVLHYPKVQKYIALFPEGTYVPHLPLPSSDTPKDSALYKRSQLRERIRKRIEKGEIGEEVEEGEMGIEGEDDVAEEEVEEDGEEEKGGKKRGRGEEEDARGSQKKGRKEEAKPPTVVAAVAKVTPVVKKEAPVPTPAPAPAAPAPAPETADVEIPDATTTTAETTERKGTRQTKKEKKDKKDAKRRAVKEAKLAAAAAGGDVVAAAKEEETEEKKEGWAGDDDFFA